MYTRCPGCKTIYAISVEQLRSGRGEALCERCNLAFGVLDTLANTAANATPDELASSNPPILGRTAAVSSLGEEHRIVAELTDNGPPAIASIPRGTALPGYGDWTEAPELSPASTSRRIPWTLGAASLLAVLLLQIIVFKGSQIAQDERFRPWLDLLCEGLPCTLPPFRSIPQIQILDKALQPGSQNENVLQFSLILSNQASLPQAFPAIKLILTDFHNQPVASGLFKPEEYLTKPNGGLMPVGKSFEIRMLFPKPRREVAGFAFELI